MSGPQSSASEVELVLETLRKEGHRRRRSTRSVRLFCAAIFSLMVVAIVLDHAKGNPFDIADLVLVSSLLGGSCAYGLAPRLHTAVKQAASLRDKRLLGPMIEALDAGEPKLKDTLTSASTELLDQITRDDAGLLDDYQLDQLVKAIRLSDDARFCRAAAGALGLIGTNRTLQSLEVFLSDPSMPPNRRSHLEPNIRAAMAELRLRLAKERLDMAAIDRPVLSSAISHAGQTPGNLGQERSANLTA